MSLANIRLANDNNSLSSNNNTLEKLKSTRVEKVSKDDKVSKKSNKSDKKAKAEKKPKDKLVKNSEYRVGGFISSTYDTILEAGERGKHDSNQFRRNAVINPICACS